MTLLDSFRAILRRWRPDVDKHGAPFTNDDDYRWAVLSDVDDKKIVRDGGKGMDVPLPSGVAHFITAKQDGKLWACYKALTAALPEGEPEVTVDNFLRGVP